MTSQDIVNLLNDLLKIDPKVITALVNNRYMCNKEMANHPSVQVIEYDGLYGLGLLGILNGISSLDNETIEAQFDEKQNIVGFNLRAK